MLPLKYSELRLCCFWPPNEEVVPPTNEHAEEKNAGRVHRIRKYPAGHPATSAAPSQNGNAHCSQLEDVDQNYITPTSKQHRFVPPTLVLTLAAHTDPHSRHGYYIHELSADWSKFTTPFHFPVFPSSTRRFLSVYQLIIN